MTTTISSWGNSLGVRIPKKELRRLWLVSGSKIRLMPSKDGIIMVPVHEKTAEFWHLLTRDQILTLTKMQYTAYINSLSPEEREEIWRREDQNETIPERILKSLDHEADAYFTKK